MILNVDNNVKISVNVFKWAIPDIFSFILVFTNKYYNFYR